MRRKFILFTILLVATLVSRAVVADAQQRTKVPRIGVLMSNPNVQAYLVSFRQALEELGYREGRNIIIEYRMSDGNPDQYPGLAADLVSLKVDIILTGSTTTTQAVKDATKTIPIVMAAVADPVGAGLVASLARPGGNITGLSMRMTELSGKRLQLLKEVASGIQRVGVLWNPVNDGNRLSWHESQVVAQAMGLQLQSIEVQSQSDFVRGFEALIRERADAFTVLRDPVIMVHLKPILEFTAKVRLPAIYEASNFVFAGGLMSYSTNLSGLYRRAATYVDKILKGASPGELPVEQSMRAELIINLKTATAIGIKIRSEVLQRADKVIR
jgi:putative tryptophan/tyrosine transport system substrate-binding protein